MAGMRVVIVLFYNADRLDTTQVAVLNCHLIAQWTFVKHY